MSSESAAKSVSIDPIGRTVAEGRRLGESDGGSVALPARRSLGIRHPSWCDIIGGMDNVSSSRLIHGRLTIIGIMLIVMGALILSLPLTIGLADMPKTVRHAVAGPVAEDTRALRRASEYDRNLLKHGTLALGEAADPFLRDSDVPAHERDADYRSQLGEGVMMAAVRIPRIGVNLPVGHGTAEGMLSTQAGHMYGTTLPVGDPGNSVIAAHRGLGARMLFYRLGELKSGDLIYTEAAGRIVSWQVESTIRVEPGGAEERRAIELDGSRVLLTLYTCDPPGLNTRRLIVTAHRVPYVDERSVPDQADPWAPWISAGITGGVAVVIALIVTPRRIVMRHAMR
ncbi:sortase [Bifidobacterium margollesii]|uniref:Sortase n=1 Tax=Bifidobacterium margollesii TaxID=2020964 RepID=A0A2N5JAW4_9BIFI|nr:sortase [Bifidobacterium margollesii]PLS31350.1 sortase [Bifidobacterium margollesii]